MDRRTFVKVAGSTTLTSAGVVAAGASPEPVYAKPAYASPLVHGTPDNPGQAPSQSRRLPDIVMIDGDRPAPAVADEILDLGRDRKLLPRL